MTNTLNDIISKTIAKRPKEFVDPKSSELSLTVLDNFAKSQEILKEILGLLYPNGKKQSKSDFSKTQNVERAIIQAEALYYSHRFCKEQYIFFVLLPIEHFHESRWSNSYYKKRIDPIVKKIDEVKKRHGLKDDEDWPARHGPREYHRLSKEYDKLFDQTFVEVLKEFGLNDLADLKEKKPQKLNKLREHGRRIFFHENSLPEAIKESIIHYEHEAVRAYKSKAYLAGIIALAAALEGVLLLLCLQKIEEASNAFLKLKGSNKKYKPQDPTTWSFEILINVCNQIGWIKNIKTENCEFNSTEIAHYLRRMRNYVHPARQCKDRAWIVTSQKEYEFSKSLYIAFVSNLNKISEILS
ncbi:hypothetical protein [Legionella tucsonensis]|uniref:Uncharacterized protein n=1 Tax=Legionella tucsonensis TaxID=40335 RepID=A0A0W0ZXI0_9GAMM|nr:hypothetical protein [Legionella tucsonensis]KTD73816.1 hypothetical protein Ltuc_1663 [Legionella tucsonensis]